MHNFFGTKWASQRLSLEFWTLLKFHWYYWVQWILSILLGSSHVLSLNSCYVFIYGCYVVVACTLLDIYVCTYLKGFFCYCLYAFASMLPRLDLLNNSYQWYFVLEKKNVIQGWRPKICKNFEMTWTIYSNSERSEQFVVTEYFFTLFLEVFQIEWIRTIIIQIRKKYWDLETGKVRKIYFYHILIYYIQGDRRNSN